MTIWPTSEKILKLKDMAQLLLSNIIATVYNLSSCIGFIVSNFPSVKYGQLYYCNLETNKSNALKANKGNYKGIACLTQHSWAETIWWLSNADMLYNDITTSAVGSVLTTGATKAGWGAVTKDNKTCGRWTPVESELNINELELKVQFGLKSLCKSKSDVHIHLRIVVTYVTYIIRRAALSLASVI